MAPGDPDPDAIHAHWEVRSGGGDASGSWAPGVPSNTFTFVLLLLTSGMDSHVSLCTIFLFQI